MVSIVWFRQDLRISDHPALHTAAMKGPVLPIYIFEEADLGGASKLWLHKALQGLSNDLDHKLNLYVGKAEAVLSKLVSAYDVSAIYMNECYEPSKRSEQQQLLKKLKNLHVFNGSLLWDPRNITKSDGSYYKVFTPFFQKGCLKQKEPRVPLPKPKTLQCVKDQKLSVSLEDLALLSKLPWTDQVIKNWDCTEKGALDRLESFIKNGLQNYKYGRNFPAKQHVSRLSPYLHFGQISPNQIWHRVKDFQQKSPKFLEDAENFLTELGWREFSYYLLYHFPELPFKNFQEKFDRFAWKENKEFLKAWQKGQTGYPIVDAGMRELWQTGYMHNRVRMIVGSFLVKNLLIDWREGAKWFWDCLFDADLANNSASWQWVAGSGADAAPYFRIFNPVTQGEKFDPEGEYTKKYVPELKGISQKYLFQPWAAPASELQEKGITLGKDYPMPIVDLKTSRMEALEAFDKTKQ